jgi:hypothetical protein
MIVVRVELHSAINGRVTELARAIIANVGGTDERGDYAAMTLRGRTAAALDKALQAKAITRMAQITGHPRKALHVWHLVAKALAGMGYGTGK